MTAPDTLASSWRSALAHPLRVDVLERLDGRVASPHRLAEELGVPSSTVAYHVRRLADRGYLRQVGSRVRRNAIEHLYTATAPRISLMVASAHLQRVLARLDAADEAPAPDRLAIVTTELATALDAAAWSISAVSDDGQQLCTLTGVESRLDPRSEVRAFTPAEPETYILGHYPLTCRARQDSGAFLAVRDRLDHDVAERGVLDALGYDAVLAVAATRPAPGFLIELYADRRTPDLHVGLPLARLLTAHATRNEPALPAESVPEGEAVALHATLDAVTTTTATDLQTSARRHLWTHFSPIGRPEPIPMYVRGEGCHLYDEDGRRYFDGLSGLFCVNAGHGRSELGAAAATQAAELGFATTWGAAHPRAVELAERIAGLAPGDLDRVFFTSGGSEAVESALKLARAYHRARGEPDRVKVIARELAYHGTTFGAMSATGLDSVREPFAPLLPGACHVATTNAYRPAATDPAEAIRERILVEGPETVSAVILEPVQNSGGCLPPPEGYFARVRAICDEFGVLLISDEIICAWGRLGHWFGCERYAFVPDIVTAAKALTSAYVPMGAMVVSERVAEPFVTGDAVFAHGLTFGGHPVAAAVALANLDLLEREGLLEHVRAAEGPLRAALAGLGDLPIVGDVRGAGFFWGIELVRDQATAEPFGDAEAHALTEWLEPELRRRGLICRAADRGYPVIQLAPPLIAGPAEFAEIVAILRPVLVEAGERAAAVAERARA